MATVVYIDNQSTEASIDFKTPHELWYNSKPDLSHLQIFCCAAYKLIPKQFRDSKFAPTSNKQILLGYEERLHNYRLLNPANGHISYSHDVIFNKEDFSHQLSQRVISPSSPDLISEYFNEVSADPLDESLDNVVQTTHASPIFTPPSELPSPLPGKHMSSLIDPQNIIEGLRRPRANTAVVHKPTPQTYKQDMAGPNKVNWMKAIQAELNNMTKHGVFTVVKLPKGAKSVGTTWVFRDKWTPTVEFIKPKARLCAQGFTQVEGVDYEETYSPTSSKTALRTLVAVASHEDLEIHKMDAVAAFLNGVPKETIYLRVPEGFKIPGRTARTVLQVNKSLYGLKQSPRCWYDDLRLFLTSIDFRASTADGCLFILQRKTDPCYAHVHVDDMNIAGKSSSIQDFKT